MKKWPLLLGSLLLLAGGLSGCQTHSGAVNPHPAAEVSSPPADGRLRAKSAGYDAWAEQQWLQPFGGVTNTIRFESEKYQQVAAYGSLSDTAIWTSLYLASQAWRYQSGGSEQARANVEKAVVFLQQLSDVTGNHVIARLVAPLREPFNTPDACQVDLRSPCIKTELDGQSAYWLGATTRDQYSGWFFGMFVAHQAVADEALRGRIAAVVKAVILQLARDDYRILPPAGKPAKVASNPNPIQLLAWASAAAAITQDPAVIEVFHTIKRQRQLRERFYAELLSFSANKFGSYVGPHLTYLNYYTLIKSTADADDRQRYLDQFRKINKLYQRDQLTLFDYLAMDLLGESSSESVTLNKNMLSQFLAAPNRPQPVYPPQAPLDQASVRLYEVNKFLYHDKTFVYPQAKNPYPQQYRCATAYSWQESPYQICCTKPEKPWSKYQLHCNTRVTENVTFGGVDFLLAYWLGRQNGYISADD